MVQQKRYSLNPLIEAFKPTDFLDYVPEHEYVTKETIPAKALGLWLKSPSNRFLSSEQKARFPDALQWHPRKNLKLPALPESFTTNELAAFWLAGGGVFMHEVFLVTDVLPDEKDHAVPDPQLDEAALDALGENADDEREGIREAHALFLKARQQFQLNDRGGLRSAAKWLLDEPQTEVAPAKQKKKKGEPAANRASLLREILTKLGFDPDKIPKARGGGKAGESEPKRLAKEVALSPEYAGSFTDRTFKDAWEKHPKIG